MKRQTTIVKEINTMFPAANPEHPICFIRDGLIVVSGECYFRETINYVTFDNVVVNYYGEFQGGYAWIHPKLETYAKDLNRYWEWENPACICLSC